MAGWQIRGLRSRCGGNECILCCVHSLFHVVEALVRNFNKYGYVMVSTPNRSFNQGSLDAWELFQSTGVEALVAFDLTGAVFVMGIVLGGLLTGTAVGCWCWYFEPEVVVTVGVTAALMGAMIIANTLIVVSGAVHAVFVVYAQDPTFIGRFDAEFAAQMAEALHNRLQKRSGKAVRPSLTAGLSGPGGQTAGLELPL